MSEIGVCVREGCVCYGLTSGWADSQPGGLLFFRRWKIRLPVSLGRIPGRHGGYLGNPAETG